MGSFASMDSTGASSVQHVGSIEEKLLATEPCHSELAESCRTPTVECSSTPTMDDVPIFEFFFECSCAEQFVDITQWAPPPDCLDFAAGWAPVMDDSQFASHWGSGVDPNSLAPNSFG